jgi:tetrapyrrole methylase family protein/MazG family protein/ATP diphosphatase
MAALAQPSFSPNTPVMSDSDLAPFDEHAPRPVPALASQDGQTLSRLVGLMRRLLGPGGCPWDREQTFDTLRKYVLEEACEVIDAIESKDPRHLREELGDLLLQIVFQSELARDQAGFAIDDVIEGIIDKLVRRHPHVFAGGTAENTTEVLQNWERIKAEEKQGRRVLEGVPRSLPALTRAQRIGEKVSRVGFDWSDREGSRAKVTEEVAELDEAILAGDKDAIEGELGDVLFALVNLSRHLDIDAEGALRRTVDKFTRRFAHVEDRVRSEHGGWSGSTLPLPTLDGYWDEAKAKEGHGT